MAYLFIMDGVPLPVTPGKAEIKYAGQNKTVNLINGGEINLIKDRKLAGISFDCLIPVLTKYPFSYYENGVFKEAVFFINHFEKLKNSKKPFSFKILRDKPGIRKSAYEKDFETASRIYQSDAFIKPWVLHNDEFSVTLENFCVKEDAGDGFDIIISTELKEYKKYGAIRLVQTSNTGSGDITAPVVAVTETPRNETKEPNKNYTIKSGDTLCNIAKKELGDGGRAGELYERNKYAIEATAKKHGRLSSSNGWWIYPGCEIRLV